MDQLQVPWDVAPATVPHSTWYPIFTNGSFQGIVVITFMSIIMSAPGLINFSKSSSGAGQILSRDTSTTPALEGPVQLVIFPGQTLYANTLAVGTTYVYVSGYRYEFYEGPAGGAASGA